jgi:hypothetical protein
MKAIVIGGGITGCVTSSFLADQGFAVDLYESSDQLGGVLKDIDLNGNLYYNDCQYLQINSPWLNELIEKTKVDIIEFPHRYGSFTCGNHAQIISNSFAGPVFQYQLNGTEAQTMLKKAQILSEDSTLAERICCYPDQLSQFLFEWIGTQTSIDISSLSHLSSISLQLSRIYLKADEDNIFSLKSQHSLLDNLLGLPRSFLYKENSELKAVLPTRGFNDLFRKFQALLEKKNVNVHISTFVKCKIKEENLIFLDHKNHTLDYDLAVWTGSPFQLIKLLMRERISNQLDFYSTYIFKFDSTFEKRNEIPFYIQVFSLDHPLRRIYLYPKDNNEQIVLVETLQSKTNVNQILSSTEDILEKFEYLAKLEFIGIKKHAKKILLTRDDVFAIGKIKDILRRYDIIDGGWHLYGREARINYVKDKIREMIVARNHP